MMRRVEERTESNSVDKQRRQHYQVEQSQLHSSSVVLYLYDEQQQ